MSVLSQHYLESAENASKDMVILEDMIDAYMDCRKHKRNTASAIEYEVDYEFRLLDLCRRVNDRSYYPGKAICFVVKRPRYREVFAAQFEDRIIHHYIGLRLMPLFEMVMGDRSFSCRPGKGQLYGTKMLEKDMKECSNGYAEDCYIMKLDLKAFFMSIDKKILLDKILSFVERYYLGDDKEDLLFMCRVVIMHDPEKNCEKRSPDEYWDRLPEEKSLFTNGEGKGLAIGNLFSQMFANYLLNELDEFCDKLGIKYHGRYVDDIYLIHKDKKVLLAAVPKIRTLLATLGLRLNEKKFYLQHYKKGVTFTGAIIKPGRSYVTNRTIGNFRKAVIKLDYANNIEDVVQAVCSANSYLGLLRQRREYNNRKKILCMINKDVFQKYVYIKGRYEVLKLKKRCTQQYKTLQEIHGTHNAKVRRARRGGGRDSKPLPPSGCRKVG